VCGHSTTVYS